MRMFWRGVNWFHFITATSEVFLSSLTDKMALTLWRKIMRFQVDGFDCLLFHSVKILRLVLEVSSALWVLNHHTIKKFKFLICNMNPLTFPHFMYFLTFHSVLNFESYVSFNMSFSKLSLFSKNLMCVIRWCVMHLCLCDHSQSPSATNENVRKMFTMSLLPKRQLLVFVAQHAHFQETWWSIVCSNIKALSHLDIVHIGLYLGTYFVNWRMDMSFSIVQMFRNL